MLIAATPVSTTSHARSERAVGWAKPAEVGFADTMIDWRHELSTTDPDYYRWTQWLFLQLHKRGLAYRKRAAVNWCPNDKTVLANEQVIAGACERCGAQVEQRFLEQWFFRITDYAGKLLDD